uniref:Uncharacterized protein n=1 Tax=Mycena chlorophos TaxID=658473 RepID=A0ABQ0L8W2_MYCCL|nr:predicted protein [Mycena chlorophos]
MLSLEERKQQMQNLKVAFDLYGPELNSRFERFNQAYNTLMAVDIGFTTARKAAIEAAREVELWIRAQVEVNGPEVAAKFFEAGANKPDVKDLLEDWLDSWNFAGSSTGVIPTDNAENPNSAD